MIALWMAYATLIAALAGLAAAALEPFARAQRVPLRWLWISAIAASMIVSVAVAIRPATIQRETADGAAKSLPLEAAPRTSAPEQSTLSLDRVLLWSWGAGATLVVVGVVMALWQLARLRRRATSTELEGVAIALTQRVGPGAAPFGSPRIFVPTWATALERRAMRLLVLHEREHLRAGDPRLLLAVTLVAALLPWNLALWWCVRRLRCAMEIDCDARVLAIDRDVQSYGDLLLRVASHRSQPRLTALLTFAESSSPLERRIRTMTERRSLHPLRASALGAVAVAAIAVACETPPPPPVAPTKTSSALAEQSRLSPAAVSMNSDSMGRALTADLNARVPAAVLHASPNDPLLLIYDARGQLLRATRLTGVTEGTRMPIGLMGVGAESIESVDVVKNVDWLPAEARGGIIHVTLKPTGTLRNEGLVSALTRQQKALAPNEVLRLPEVAIKVPVAERALSKKEAAGLGTMAVPLVEIRDSENRLLFTKRMESAGRMTAEENSFADLPAAPDDIARMDVTKPPSVIRIWLKPGAKLRNVK